MKIGLVRHFKVMKDYPRGLVSSEELVRWFEEYDTAPIAQGVTEMGAIMWRRCLTSDLPRAAETAQHIYDGEITSTPLLREIPHPNLPIKLRLPFLVWALIIRLSWAFHRPTKLDLQRVDERIEAFLNQTLAQSQEDMLIVSHSAFMMKLRKALLKRGFRGPGFAHPENGKLYVYTREQ